MRDNSILESKSCPPTILCEHRKALQNCKPLDGPEVREVVRCKVEDERRRGEEVVETHRLRLADQQKAYQALEDEFRMALRIEASRYQEVRGILHSFLLVQISAQKCPLSNIYR